MSLVLLSFEFVKAPTAPTKTKTPRVGRFDCPLTACEHFYKRKGDLKAHMLKKHAASETAAFLTSIMKARSSVDGKPFVCPHPRCRHGYLRSRGLRRHINDKHRGRPAPSSNLGTSSDSSCDTIDDSY